MCTRDYFADETTAAKIKIIRVLKDMPGGLNCIHCIIVEVSCLYGQNSGHIVNSKNNIIALYYLDCIKQKKQMTTEIFKKVYVHCDQNFDQKSRKEGKERLKVSKYQKQNTKFSHSPKNQQNFVHFFALTTKCG